MYKCEHFKIQELVPPQVYNDRGDLAWELLDDRALRTIDCLRADYGTCIINNWSYGGERMWSGLRTVESPYYSPYSQHSFGRAFDCIFTKVTAEQIRQDIVQGRRFYPDISGMELNTSWLHVDVRNTVKIKMFNP